MWQASWHTTWLDIWMPVPLMVHEVEGAAAWGNRIPWAHPGAGGNGKRHGPGAHYYLIQKVYGSERKERLMSNWTGRFNVHPSLKRLLVFPCIPALRHLCCCCSQGNAVFYAWIMLQVWEFSSDFQSTWGLQDPAVVLHSSSSFPACSWQGSTNQMLSVLLNCCGPFCSSSLATTHHLSWNILHLASSYFSCKATYHGPTPGDSDKHSDSVGSWEAVGKVWKH